LANRKNAIIKINTDEKRRVVNRRVITELRSVSRSFREACEAKDSAKATDISKSLFSKIDKAIKRGTIKENTGNRRKSRFSKHLLLIKA
jgi:small subunit ribosomal protein S20